MHLKLFNFLPTICKTCAIIKTIKLLHVVNSNHDQTADPDPYILKGIKFIRVFGKLLDCNALYETQMEGKSGLF